MMAYKLFKVRKDGTIGSLFINRKERLTRNKWLKAKKYPTKGYALRPFWHCTSQPVAPHLTTKNRQWVEVEIKKFIKMNRPKNQGGLWYLAKQIMIGRNVYEN